MKSDVDPVKGDVGRVKGDGGRVRDDGGAASTGDRAERAVEPGSEARGAQLIDARLARAAAVRCKAPPIPDPEPTDRIALALVACDSASSTGSSATFVGPSPPT